MTGRIKFCVECKEDKSVDDYYKRYYKTGTIGYSHKCKVCQTKINEYYKLNVNAEKKKEQRKRHAKEVFLQKRIHAKNHANKYPEKIKERWKKYYEKNAEKLKERARNYSKNNRDKKTAYSKKWHDEKRKTDAVYKLKITLRSRLNNVIRYNGATKKISTEESLGATFDIVKRHIERQFKKGMTWENHGRGDGKWQIDHKIPLASAKTEEEMYFLFHYTNLQPLWAVDNRNKSDKILPTQIIMTI